MQCIAWRVHEVESHNSAIKPADLYEHCPIACLAMPFQAPTSLTRISHRAQTPCTNQQLETAASPLACEHRRCVVSENFDMSGVPMIISSEYEAHRLDNNAFQQEGKTTPHGPSGELPCHEGTEAPLPEEKRWLEKLEERRDSPSTLAPHL